MSTRLSTEEPSKARIEAAWQAHIIEGQTYTQWDRDAFESGYKAALEHVREWPRRASGNKETARP